MRGFYKGFALTLANNSKLCLQFPLYDKLKSKTDSVVVSSMLSKIISSTIYYPTDLIRTNQRNMKNNLNMFETAKNLYKVGGCRGFYNGVVLYNMVSIPSFIVMMMVKEWIQSTSTDK
jgi:hypothetical protein